MIRWLFVCQQKIKLHLFKKTKKISSDEVMITNRVDSTQEDYSFHLQ